MKRAVLFDLDETLVVEEPAAAASFEAAARCAVERHEIDSLRLAADARSKARALWYAAPTFEYCMRVGISSWEGLWCRFEGEEPELVALREWSPEYRREAWRLALADQAVEDSELAGRLAERFDIERRSRHQVFADVDPVLGQLKKSHSLALVTNGAACLQREKLAASGLSKYFDVVVVSAEVGVAKPDAVVFNRALSELGVDRRQAVMVGDSLSKDVDGALAVGLHAVWVNRADSPSPDRPDLIEISRLSDLPGVVAGLDQAGG